MHSPDMIMAELEICLAEDGVRGALAYLNGRVAHRFTALHIKDVDVLKNVYVYDSDDPTAKPFMNLPVYETYCARVLASKQPLVINNATEDGGVLDPAQNTIVKSYCGLPLQRPDGSVFGTLCHYDFQPCEIHAAELEFLQTASRILSTTLNNIATL